MSVRIMTRVTILVSYFLVIVLVSPYKSTVAARPGIKDDDPYTVLGVKRTATVDDVQRAYRQRARETHRKCTRTRRTHRDIVRMPRCLICRFECYPRLPTYFIDCSSYVQSLPQPTRTHPPTRTMNSDASPPRSKYWAIRSIKNGTTHNMTKK